MSAVGGGGRSFPVYIDLILRGVPQSQSQLRGVTASLTDMGTAASRTAAPFNVVNEGLRGIGVNSRTAVAGASGLTSATTGMSRNFRSAGDGAIILSNSLSETAVQTRAATSGISPLTSGMQQLASQSSTTGEAMSRHSAISIALRENIRSMIFPIGGMIGALNEAAFMSGRSADMDAKLAAAKAEVARLASLGAQGTTEYANAVKDAEEAQRALNFTNRIATQSWFDVVFFMGSLLGAATGLQQRYSDLRRGTAAVSTATKGMGGIFDKLVNTLTGTNLHFTKTLNSQKALAKGMGPLSVVTGRTKDSFSNLIPAMSGAATGSATLAAFLKGSLIPAFAVVGVAIGSAVAAFAAFGGVLQAFENNIGGVRDSLTKTVSGWAEMSEAIVGAIPGLEQFEGKSRDTAQKSLLYLSQMNAGWEDMVNAIAGAVGLEEPFKDIEQGATGATVALTGVADEAGILAVALDGTLVPAKDLAKANMDLGATAGALLEANGKLGAGMINLQNGMKVSGDVAILLADAFIKTQQEAIKEEMALAQLVVQHYGLETAMRLSKEEIIDLGKWLKSQGETVEGAAESTERLTAAQQRSAAQAEVSSTAFADYNAEAVLLKQGNLDAIAGLTQLGTKFDENAVAIAATNEGMTEYRATQIAAFADTRKTAEALGFQGEAYKATTAELLNYIANAQQQNDVNADGVASYLELSQANRDYLATLGLTSSVMGEVSDGTRDLTERESLLIQVMSGVEEASARNVDGMIELVVAGEDVNRVIGLTNEQIAAELQALEASGEAHELTAEAIQEHADAMAELDPMIQNVAKAWGIYTAEGANANEVNRRLTDELLPELQSRLEDVRSRALEFAEAVGVDMKTAYSMSTEELVNYIANLKGLPAEFETAAEASERAAEAFNESWTAAFDEMVAAQEEWAGNFTSALESVGEELGEELEGIGTDAKEKFKAGIAFTDQFWNEAFPAGMARAAFDKNVDIEDMIEDTKELIDNAVSEGLISEEQAEASFEPFISWMETNLPEDTRQAMAMLNAAMPELIARFGGTVVEGIGKLDTGTAQAIHNAIVLPAQTALRIGFGGEAMGPLVVDNLRALIPRIEEQNPEFAAAFKNALVDPLTGQERPIQEQVEKIFALFQSMPDEYGAVIRAMDQNDNNVPDMLERGIVTPVQQSVNDIVADWNSLPPAAGTAASNSTTDFKTNWLTGVTSMNLAAGILPKLDEIPPAAGETGSEATTELVSKFGELPPGVAEVVTRTGDEFAVLKDKLVTQGTLIGGALNIIALTFTKLRDYANGPQGLGGIGVGVNYGPMQTGLQVALSALNTNTVIGLGQIMASWILHFQALNAVIPQQLGLVTQIFSRYFPLINTAVIMGLATVMASWLIHFQGLNATIPVQLGLTAQIFSQYMGLVNQAVILGLGTVMLSWVNHFTVLNNYVNQTFPTIIGTFNTWMAAAAANVLSFTTFMSAYWAIHASSVSATVGTIAQHMGALASEYAALSSGVNATMSAISGYWITHASSLLGSVRMAVGHMVNYAREILALSRGVNRTTSQMSGFWITHARSLQGSVNAMNRHLRSLASAVSMTMRSIVSSMRLAMAAANALRASINRLRNKSITVTTRYRTVGSPGRAARGFSGVVNRPTDIHAGEGGRPELVNITPLQGTSGARLNGMAAFRNLTPARIGAGNGLSPGSIMTGSSGTTTKAVSHTTGSQTTIRKQVISNASSSGQSSVMVSRGNAGGNPVIIDNHIILDSSEMKRWIRKVANEDYRASR